MLVLLIIYAKRRESARFLRIQNNLQGILGKQALLTTYYGYTHYGYTYYGSLGNKQAPYSPLQPSYHPLYPSSHPLQRRTVPHSGLFPQQLHALAGGVGTEKNLNPRASGRRSSIGIGVGHADLFGSHTNIFGDGQLSPGGDNQLAPWRASGRRASCGLPGLSLFQGSTSVEPARQRGLSAVAYAGGPGLPGSSGLAELPGLPEDSVAPSKMGRVGMRRCTGSDRPPLAGNGPAAPGSAAAPEPSAAAKKPVKKSMAGGAKGKVAGSMKPIQP